MTVKVSLSGFTSVVATKAQVSSDLAEEAVILHLKSGTYYGLNPVGRSIWALVQAPKTVNQIREAVLEEYDVSPDVCDRDLQVILHDLLEAELLEVHHAEETV